MTDSTAKPRRIQRKRTKGWVMPANTVYIGRPTKYANPHKLADFLHIFDKKDEVELDVAKAWVMRGFGEHLTWMQDFEPEKYKTILSELRGKNVCCWCGLGDECEGDVWLELANPEHTFERVK